MRKLKILVLAGLAVLAVSAVTASAANAATATVSAGTTTYTATQTGTGHTFTLVGGRVLSCTNATFSGSISDGDTSVTATPAYSSCSVKVGASTLPATVNVGSCDYNFSSLSSLGSDKFSSLTDVKCTSGSIVITVYSNHTNHTSGTRLCEYQVAPATGLTNVSFTDNTNGTINIDANAVSVPTQRTFGNAVNCGEEKFKSTYNGNTVATAATGTLGIH